jgi:hypothetical protein
MPSLTVTTSIPAIGFGHRVRLFKERTPPHGEISAATHELIMDTSDTISAAITRMPLESKIRRCSSWLSLVFWRVTETSFVRRRANGHTGDDSETCAMRVFKDRKGRRWTVEAGVRGDDTAFIAFVALDGKDRPRTLTVSQHETDFAKVSDEQLRAWLEQAVTHGGQSAGP